jgi:acyl-CoA synthetase (AMP-forming)/AMP-acid ligase II
VAFDAPVVQGYGMTENAGAACAMAPSSPTVGTVGAPICATEIKLVDVAEMEYLHTDVYPATREEFNKQVTFKGDFQTHLAGRKIPRGVCVCICVCVFVCVFVCVRLHTHTHIHTHTHTHINVCI